MSKKTKAQKHARRVNAHKRRHRKNSPFKLPMGFTVPPMPEDVLISMALDHVILQLLRTTGISDAIRKAMLKPPDENNTPETIQ